MTIENKNSKAFNILTAGSILDDDRLESMSLGSQSCHVRFLNSRTQPHKNPREEFDFQLMPANGKLTTTIDLLDVRDAHSLCGKQISILSISATIHAAEVGNTTLVREIPYNLDSVFISHQFFPPLPEAFEGRVHKYSPDYLSVLKEGISSCASHATAAREAALNGSAGRMEAYFKESSQETRQAVADTFAKVAKWLKRATLKILEFITRHMIFCKRGYFQHMLPDVNEVSSVTHTIVHEMTHLSFVKATRDIGSGLYDSTLLDKESSLSNADSYALFSDAVYLKEEALNQTRADIAREKIRKISYNAAKLGNITRSEFLSLAPAVRAKRFGFELK